MKFHANFVPNEQLTIAFDVLTATAAWLRAEGRRQRISHTSFNTYRDWQSLKANYAVFERESIAGVFSLPTEEVLEWPHFSDLGPVVWLRALATRPDYRGQKVGEFAVKSALRIAGQRVPIYLDCVSGFLPDYYSDLGFETLSQQVRQYPQDGSFEITLMRHLNGRSPVSFDASCRGR